MHLFSNILIGLVVISLTITIQGIGTKFWLDHVEKRFTNIPARIHSRKSLHLLIQTGFFLLLLHFIEAGVWAFTYFILPSITEFQTFEKAMYFSLVTFTTLGYGDITISSANRILAGFEAINGILLIGWSTTLMFSTVQHIIKQNRNYGI